MGSFPIIFSKSVVFVKLLCVNTPSVFSPLTAALHAVDLMVYFLLLHCGNLGPFGLFLHFTKTMASGKQGINKKQ